MKITIKKPTWLPSRNQLIKYSIIIDKIHGVIFLIKVLMQYSHCPYTVKPEKTLVVKLDDETYSYYSTYWHSVLWDLSWNERFFPTLSPALSWCRLLYHFQSSQGQLPMMKWNQTLIQHLWMVLYNNIMQGCRQGPQKRIRFWPL